MASTDTRATFKENVTEIRGNWDSSPLYRGGQLNTAVNAGVVELRCFINNSCPFNSSPRKEDILVFNDKTMERILPMLPAASLLMYTTGMEGIHFVPRYVFRHNYIFKPDPTTTASDNPTNYERLVSNFERYYKEITYTGTQQVPGAAETRYRAEQSWIVARSVFDYEESSSAEECFDAEWYYDPMSISQSDETDLDDQYDYRRSYYRDYINKSSNIPAIIKKLVQVPVQTNVYNKNQKPVHWRLDKRTPLYRGEDFFIRFYKKAKVTTIDNTNDTTPPFNNSEYKILDVTCRETVEIDSGDTAAGRPPLKRRCNYGITPLMTNSLQIDTDRFNLYNQAYYLVELGRGTYDENYFILITEKNPPVFIMRQKFAAGDISRILGVCEQVDGSQLINAQYFDMTVRNHLGKLVIIFSTPSGQAIQPWVISRTDWYPHWDLVAQEVVLEEKARNIVVPRGMASIWGGNLRSGFVFGPLQYKTSYLSFVYPPRQLAEPEAYDLAFSRVTPEDVGRTGYKGSFETNPFFLPMGGDHHILFTSANLYLSELQKYVYLPDVSAYDHDLFTQDAQYFYEYHDRVGANGTSHSVVDRGPQEGYFFYSDRIKELPDDFVSPIHVKHSWITAQKYRYLNDLSTRHQAFDVLVGMMAGDHIFTAATWMDLSPDHTYPPSSNGDPNTWQNIYDTSMDQWFVPNCKTPILTHMRLVCDESATPRWNDGTTIAQGTAKTPLENNSPYYFDATDHVMSYSESWAANSWYEVEHTGTLQFYLNREMVTVENNVTDYLLALQNKSFYVDIWAGYRDCSACNFVGLFKLFTGICHGGSIEYQYNKHILSCKVVDYSAVLKAERFFNSPWFDGMKDINAIWEILRNVGFRSRGKYDPGTVLRVLSGMAAAGDSQMFFHHWDGRPFKMEPFALPSGYSRLEQPGFKFNDGEPLYDAVVKIAKKAGKTFYFDQFGQARYEDLQDVVEKDYLGRVPLVPLFDFTTNPDIHSGQLVHNKVERRYDVAGMSNHIKILSNTPDFHLLIRDALSWQSVENPATEGFLGYKKTFYQPESLFGSKQAVINAVNKYKVMWRPQIHVKFETYGLPLRANDIISLDGETSRVISVNHTIDARQNQWWMEVECMRYQPVIGASLLPDNTGEEWSSTTTYGEE